jgi:hypothetical protein
MRPILPFVLFWLLLGSLPVEATYVSPVGNVIVSQGDGFQTIEDKTEVNVGDVVVVYPGALARIVYPDGCMVEVTPGSITKIEDHSARTPPGECIEPPARSVARFTVGTELVIPPEIGVIIAKDADLFPARPAGP